MGVSIDRSLRLNQDGFYHSGQTTKTAIVLHHTVGGSARSTFHWWQRDRRHIATAFIIGRDGTVYELFDPELWAYHLGIRGSRGVYDKSTIGIELASVGPLIWDEGKFYCFDRVTSNTEYKGRVFDVCALLKDDCRWRGWRFFAVYPDEQIEALKSLLDYLSLEFRVVLRCPKTFDVLETIPSSGVYAHSHVRSDKSDVHIGFSWRKIEVEW